VPDRRVAAAIKPGPSPNQGPPNVRINARTLSAHPASCPTSCQASSRGGRRPRIPSLLHNLNQQNPQHRPRNTPARPSNPKGAALRPERYPASGPPDLSRSLGWFQGVALVTPRYPKVNPLPDPIPPATPFLPKRNDAQPRPRAIRAQADCQHKTPQFCCPEPPP
jgi:hypothetical protein